jgi:uncharacterized protein (TIGR03435 family)
MHKDILAALIIAFTAFAQTPAADKSLTFEVASIKPLQSPRSDIPLAGFLLRPSGGPGSNDPGRINYPYMTLKNLLMTAYNVKNYQISGPGWLDSEWFNITATMPPDTTKEQLQIMLQNLLMERFKMSVHREKKNLPMYSLVVTKPGKLKESTASGAPVGPDNPPSLPPPGPPKMGPDGFPVLPLGMTGRPGIMMMMMPGRARLMATAQTMQDFATRLSNQLNRPVIDNTGLTAKYDFTLTYAPDPNEGPGRGGPVPGGAMIALAPGPGPGAGAAAGAAPGPGPAPGGNDNAVPDAETPPPLFGAVQSQLGLKLEPKKGAVDIIVIDRIEKTPTEN